MRFHIIALVLSTLSSVAAQAAGSANYNCTAANGAQMEIAALSYMVTVISPRVKPYEFVTHGKESHGRVSLIGFRHGESSPNDEMIVDKEILAFAKKGRVDFQGQSFSCRIKPLGFLAFVAAGSSSSARVCDCYKLGDDGHPVFIDRLPISECFAQGGTGYSNCD